MTKTSTTRCTYCGGKEFVVIERYQHVAEVNDDGELLYSGWPDSGGRERIECNACHMEIGEDVFSLVENC